jgi:hypothetical protein
VGVVVPEVEKGGFLEYIQLCGYDYSRITREDLVDVEMIKDA